MLEGLIEHYTRGNKAQFAKRLNVSAQTISAWIARSTFDAELIYTKCSDVNPRWLLTGEGEMLAEEGAAGTAEATTQGANNTNSAQMMQIIIEQAQEIGKLKEQVRQLTIEQEKLAARANTATIANAG